MQSDDGLTSLPLWNVVRDGIGEADEADQVDVVDYANLACVGSLRTESNAWVG